MGEPFNTPKGEVKLVRVSPATCPGQCWTCAWPRWLHWWGHAYEDWQDAILRLLREGA